MGKRIILAIALSLMLFGICDVSVKYLSKRQLGLTEVFVASHKIKPRSRITEQDLKIVYLPKDYLSENVIVKKEELLGKYTLTDIYVFKDQLFYKEALEDQSYINDYPLFLLEDGQALYELEIAEIESPRFNIRDRQYVDLYLTVRDSKNAISDLLISDVEIVAAYDAKGNNIKDKDAGSIFSIVLAIDESQINILNVARVKGKLSLYLKNDSYKEVKESVLNESSTVLKYLEMIE